MKYIIHRKELLESEGVRQKLEKIAAEKIKKIEKLLKGYPKSPLVEIFISKISRDSYRMAVSLKLKSRLVYVDEKGRDPEDILKKAFDKVLTEVKKTRARERKEYYYKRKNRRAEDFTRYAYKLDEYYEEKEREQFEQLLGQLLPHIRNYVLRYMKLYGKGKHLVLDIKDVMDEVMGELYNRYEERPKNPANISAWCYKIAYRTMQKIFEDKSEERSGDMDVAKLARKELDVMNERYTVDGDGDYIMFEELDDISYRNYKFSDEIVLNENLEEDAEVLHEIEDREFHDLVAEVLEGLSAEQRQVFEHYWLDEMTEEEIAEATGKSKAEIAALIRETGSRIREELEKLH